MERSASANVIATTRLVGHFDQKSLNHFKHCLLDQLSMQSECQLICYLLRNTYKLMEEETVKTLKNKAIQLAKKQPISTESELSVLQAVERQHTDHLSKMPSDVIDLIGSMLIKKESISFGYSNRQLYIESQKKSYLVKRIDNRFRDKQFKLTPSVVKKLSGRNSEMNPFAFGFGADLRLGAATGGNCKQKQLPTKEDIVDAGPLHTKWFESLFYRVTKLECWDNRFLPFVPVHLLFNKKLHSQSPIHRLFFQSAPLPGVKPFLDAYTKFATKNSSNVREIDWLKVVHKAPSATYDVEELQNIVLTLTKFSRVKTLMLHNAVFKITSFDQLNALFGSNIHHLSIEYPAMINFNLNNDVGSDFIPSVNHLQLNFRLLRLFHHITTMEETEKKDKIIKFFAECQRLQLLSCMDTLTMRLWWNCFGVNRRLTYLGSCLKKIMETLLKTNMPQLQKIVLELEDMNNLDVFGALLEYIAENKHWFLNIRSLQSIEVKWVKIGGASTHVTASSCNNKIFHFEGDEKYNVKARKVECQSDLSMKSLASIYQNAVEWMKTVSEQADLRSCLNRSISISIQK